MIHDHQRNVLFIAGQAGNVFVLNCLTTEPELIINLKTDKQVCIQGLARSIGNAGYLISQEERVVRSHYILAADKKGYITIFDINTPGKESLSKRVGAAQGASKQRVILWRDNGREIISGDQEGFVTFWYVKNC